MAGVAVLIIVAGAVAIALISGVRYEQAQRAQDHQGSYFGASSGGRLRRVPSAHLFRKRSGMKPMIRLEIQ